METRWLLTSPLQITPFTFNLLTYVVGSFRCLIPTLKPLLSPTYLVSPPLEHFLTIVFQFPEVFSRIFDFEKVHNLTISLLGHSIPNKKKITFSHKECRIIHLLFLFKLHLPYLTIDFLLPFKTN